MKNNFIKILCLVTSLLLIFSVLPLGFAATADDSSIIPEYPENAVLKIDKNIDYTSADPTDEDTIRMFDNPVDFTDENYDFFEMDGFFTSTNTYEEVIFAIFDSNSNIATHSIGLFNSNWGHISIATDAFSGENVDFTDICGFMLLQAQGNVRYLLTNLCMTGIKQPETLPKAEVLKLKNRIDFTDTKTNSAMTDIYYFDELDFADIYSKDWLEFDIYVEGTSVQSVDSTQMIYLVDEDYGPDSKRGKNTANYRFKVKTNGWHHIKVPTNNLTVTNCKTDKIVGAVIGSTLDNYRYIVANLCLTTALSTPPEINEKAEIAVSGIITKYFNVTKNGTLPEIEFESLIDISKNKHIVFDMFIDSASSEEQNLTFVLTDKNGKTAKYSFVCGLSEWKNIKTPVRAITFDEGFDKTACAKLTVENLSETTGYQLANFGFLDVDMTIEEGYPENAISKAENVDIKYYVTEMQKVKEDTLVNFDTVDISDCDFIEVDAFVDTPIDAQKLPEKLSLTFVDTNGNMATVTQIYEYNSLGHVTFNVSAMVNKDNGKPINKAEICGVFLENTKVNFDYAVKNLCFTKITAPPPPEKNVQRVIKKYVDFTSTAHGETCTLFVPFEGIDENDLESVIDFKNSEYIELDIYAVMDVSREDYSDIITPTLNVCDNQFQYITHLGKGEAGMEVKVNQWNHIKIDLNSIDISAGRNTDLTKMRGFFIGMSSPKNIRYVVANMCLGARATPEKDTDKPAKPDEKSRYISDCESANSAEEGVWISSQTGFNSDYKTEGKRSISLRVQNREIETLNSFRYSFNSIADLSKSKSVKLDLFIDDEYLVDDCTFELYFSGDRRHQDKNFKYIIDSQKLKFGWNSIEVPLTSFKADSDADWKNINCFALLVLINEPFETVGKFEEFFVMALDNIRISETYELLETEVSEDDEDLGLDTEIGFDNSKEEIKENVIQKIQYIENAPEEKILRLKKQVIKKKAVEIDDIYGIHNIILIVTTIVTILIFAANAVALILSRKKKIK